MSQNKTPTFLLLPFNLYYRQYRHQYQMLAIHQFIYFYPLPFLLNNFSQHVQEDPQENERLNQYSKDTK